MAKSISPQEAKFGPLAINAVLWPIAVYLVWTLATYLLEGRINLLQQPTISGRYVYVLIANVLIGTVGAIWIVRSLVSSHLVTLEQLGFRSAGRTLLTVVIAVLIGVGYLWLMRPATLSPLVIVNGYAQVLTVSIAEIIVCWALVGVSFESLLKAKGRFLAALAGIVAATVFFSVYHVGHSAPFNQINMMLILLVPGILTSLFYFMSREIYATILFHNFQGTVGVISSLENPEILNQPLYLLYLLMFLAIVAIIGADLFLARRART